MPASRIADHVGRVLGGRYRLIAPIGTGASAHVYLAEDATLKRNVAVKVLHSALAEDEAFLRRFRAEAQQAAALNHPHVMRVYDWGEADDGPYLVLEHLGGGSLRDLLDAGRLLTPAQAAQAGAQAARALEYAHRRGLVHRDIKPANLLYDDEGRLCIADFGLARALAEASWTEPAGAVLGTARYASPEQAQGGSVDGKADVYALALVLVEAVTGSVPFTADTTIATLMARVGRALDAPEALGPLAPVVERAADPDPATRPDAATLVRLLEEAARALPAPEPVNLAGPAAAPVTEAVDLRDHTELGARSRLFDIEAAEAPDPVAPLPSAGRRRRKWPFVLLAVLMLLGLAGGAYAARQATLPEHPVPDLTGKPLAEARRLASASKLGVSVRAEEHHETAPPGTVLSQRPPTGELKEGRPISVVVSRGPAPRPVPDLGNQPEAKARELLDQAGFPATFVQAASETVGRGHVVDWQPKGVHPKGTNVVVTLSSGPPLVQVPDVAGMTYEAAAKALADAGFQAQRRDDYSDAMAAGKVVNSTPSAGSSAPKGAKVTVTVSKGPETIAVPDVRGQSIDQAKAALSAAGLTPGTVYGPPNARRVIDTSPSAGSRVKRGDTVDLYVK